VDKTGDHYAQISYPIGNRLLGVEMDNKSFMSFLNKLDSVPPEPIPGGGGVFTPEGRKDPPGFSRNGEPDLTKSGDGGNHSTESEKKANPTDSFLKKDDVKPTESKKKASQVNRGRPSWALF
jgi:hypothetical protein